MLKIMPDVIRSSLKYSEVLSINLIFFNYVKNQPMKEDDRLRERNVKHK